MMGQGRDDLVLVILRSRGPSGQGPLFIKQPTMLRKCVYIQYTHTLVQVFKSKMVGGMSCLAEVSAFLDLKVYTSLVCVECVFSKSCNCILYEEWPLTPQRESILNEHSTRRQRAARIYLRALCSFFQTDGFYLLSL